MTRAPVEQQTTFCNQGDSILSIGVILPPKAVHLLRITFRETLYLVKSKYLGSRLGVLWLVLNPLLLAGIYTFIMAFIFKVRLGPDSSTLDYAAYLLIGMGAFNAASDSITLATSSVTGNSNLVKNLVFPMKVLPLSAMLASTVSLLVNLVVAWILMAVMGKPGGWALLLLPLWIILQYFALSGLCLFLAAYNVFSRDVQQLLGPVLTLLMFASPVFYVAEMVPEKFRAFWVLNPFSHLLGGYREILLWGRAPDWESTLILLVVGGGFLYFGRLAFNRSQPHFEEWL